MKTGMVFMGMGFELVGLILGSYYLGSQLDEYFGWKGYGVAGLIVVCMIGWMVHLVVLLKRFQAQVPPPPPTSGGNP